jgi:transposase
MSKIEGMRVLRDEERASLEVHLKKTKELNEWKRLFAIVGYHDGQSIEELAEALRLSPFTIEEYLKQYTKSNKTKNDPRGGKDSKLTEEESKELEAHLSQKTYLKVKHIVAYVAKQYSKKYSRSGMNAWLLEHGFVYKQPQTIPGKSNPEEQAKFIEKYQELKKGLGPEDEIYFVDAVHPEYQSQAVCGWIKKGECKTLQTSGKQARLHFTGALRLDQMGLLVTEYKTVDADAMIDFFKKLEGYSQAPNIHLILDNARAHKNKQVEEYLKNSRITLHYLPPYSPNLNVIERLWKLLREKTVYDHYYPCAQEFFGAVRKFFNEEVSKMGEELKRMFTDKFQIIKPNPIHIV